MHPVIAKTFGGLTTRYYIRQFLFGFAVTAFVTFMSFKSPHPAQFGVVALIVVNTFLYPYSRFAYESVVGFIMGSNLFFLNAFVMLFVKGLTILLCWVFAVFIAPIGLLYLYVHHSRASSTDEA